MSARHRWLAVGLGVTSAVLVGVGIAAVLATPGGSGARTSWSLFSFVLPIAAFSTVGGVIMLRRPGNVIGWLLAGIGLLFAIVVACSGISGWAVTTGALPRAAGEWISVGSNAWVAALGLIGTQLPLRLPVGALPSPRWRWFSRLSILFIGLSVGGMAIQPGLVEGVPGTANPLGVESLQGLAAIFTLVLLSFVVALFSLVQRYRRTTASHERAQLRWIAFGGVLFFVVYFVTLPVASAFGDGTPVADVLTAVSQAAFGALPIAIGYAVLKHRLYDIEAVVSRALVYGALTATLASAYLALVLLLQLVLSPLTEQSDLSVAASTLAVAALFRPARSRIQAIVDRRFYRRRYDAARTLEAFSLRLRDEIDLEVMAADVRDVVAGTVQPAHLSLWLRGAER